MKIVFVSNFFNHHQKYLCDELFRLSLGEFVFVETSKMDEERKLLGYILDEVPDYVMSTSYNENECMIHILEADLVIAGSTPYKLLKQRIKDNKLIFRYCERSMRNIIDYLKYGYRFFKWHNQYPNNANVYILCASAYTALDFYRLHLFRNRTFKWGYFPETKQYSNINKLILKKKRNEILWCGRYLGLKRPLDAIHVAKRLKIENYDFVLNFIGQGALENEMKQKVIEYGVETNIRFLGSMKPERVREYMEHAGIYLFTSDRQEGWGAVLNESMNSACAVIASHSIGAVPLLIDHNENGLVYESGNVEQLYKHVKFLLDNPDEQLRLGKEAYKTIIEEWNAEKAAERLTCLAKSILEGNDKPELYEHGPCSKAGIIKETWFKKEC